MYQIRQNRLVGLKLEQLGGDIPLIERSSYDAGMCDPDWDYSPRGEIRQSGKKTTLRNVLREIHDEHASSDPKRDYSVSVFERLVDLQTVKESLSELFPGGPEGHLISLLPVEQDETKQVEAERQHLESAAREIAHRHGVQVNSLAFIEACERELDGFSDYREGMREDGLCIGFGVTPDQWYEEHNASQGDSSHVHEILGWLAEHCPLLWAQHQEQKQQYQEA